MEVSSFPERFNCRGTAPVPLRVAAPSTLEWLQHASLLGQASQEHFLHPAVRLPFVSLSLELTQRRAESFGKETLDGVLIGFGLGSFLSSGNAQYAVNQEAAREEAIRQEKARRDAVAKRKADNEAATLGTTSRESPMGTSGDNGGGKTASGSEKSPPPRPPALDNR